jgi:hypothetical protein
MEGTVTADEVGITFRFKALNSSEKKATSGRTIPWSQIESVTYSRRGKYSPAYFRVVTFGETSVPKATKDPYGLTANVGTQADQMKLFADQIIERLASRTGAPPEARLPNAQKRSVADAKRQMGVKVGARREVRKLKAHLLHGEQVRYVAAGTVDRRRGLVALTDRRLLVLFHGHLRQTVEDIALDRITSVNEKAGMLLGTLTVLASNTTLTISDIEKRDMKNLAAALRTRMASGSLPPLPPIDTDDLDADEPAPKRSGGGPNSRPDPAPDGDAPLRQLEQLASMLERGIITQADYDETKARLLGQL